MTDMEDRKLMLTLIRTVAATMLILVPVGAGAAEFKAGSLVIETPWSRATPGGAKVAGGYARIRNTGPAPDRLLGGTLTVSSRSEVHETAEANGVSSMRHVAGGLEIRPGEAVDLKPGGLHLMFTDLQRPLKQGEVLAGSLQFEKAGTVAVEFVVGSIGAQSGPEPQHKH